ncbi:hypothetical protein TIFTF001_036357 [Ficus carica]|uniref:Uncharacterized protein n=1 Tax=Ficus carica TaxID=3494 RepID=A0AA88E432_FICCA|nr:hypothetical protein TIFTF001_036357 [Ficus carica]
MNRHSNTNGLATAAATTATAAATTELAAAWRRKWAINPKVTYSNQNPYPMSFVITKGSLLLQPDLEQHIIGHSIQEQVKEKFSSMMASKLPRVVPTCHKGGFGSWFDLDWTCRPNHSMTARHGIYTHVSSLSAMYDTRLWGWVVKGMDPRRIEEDREASLAFWEMEPRTYDGTQGAADLAEWLHDMETIFRLCHIGAHLQVMLASRRLMGEARLWWLSLGDPRVPTDVWVNF